ncbi:MAG: hypothetical protein R2789_13140 [Microthrixaceae bacterium]
MKPANETADALVGVVEHDERRLASQLEEHPRMFWAAEVMTLVPVAVEPVKETRSTRGLLRAVTPMSGPTR